MALGAEAIYEDGILFVAIFIRGQRRGSAHEPIEASHRDGIRNVERYGRDDQYCTKAYDSATSVPNDAHTPENNGITHDSLSRV